MQAKTYPLRDLFFPASQDLNYHMHLTPHTSCIGPTFRFHASGNPKHVRSVSAFWGQYTHPRSIFSSWHLRTSTIISTSPHALPSWAPHFVSMPQAIPSTYAQYSHFGVNIPTPARSFLPGISVPQLLYQPHPTHFLYAPRQPFLSQANAKRMCTVLGSGWSK